MLAGELMDRAAGAVPRDRTLPRAANEHGKRQNKDSPEDGVNGHKRLRNKMIDGKKV
jgi:hypothetical protein